MDGAIDSSVDANGVNHASDGNDETDASGMPQVSGADDPRSAYGEIGQAPAPKHRRSMARVLREYAILALVAVVLASIVRTVLGQAYWIPSPSMVPTLKERDRVIVSRISYKLGDPERGDIIVFQNPDFEQPKSNMVATSGRNLLELFGIGQKKDKYFIKRAIGLPGDRVEVKNDHVYINGKKLDEPWLSSDVRTVDVGTFGGKEFVVPKGQYFMMGDNREVSRDSRYFGPIKRSKMVGRAFVRIFPFGRFGGL